MEKTKVGRLVKSMYGTQDASHIWQLDYVNLTCGEIGGFRRGKHSAALFHNPNEDVRMAVHSDDFVCLSDDDGLKHIDILLKSIYTAKDMGTLGFGDSDVKSYLLLSRLFGVGTDQIGHYLDCDKHTHQHSTCRVAQHAWSRFITRTRVAQELEGSGLQIFAS